MTRFAVFLCIVVHCLAAPAGAQQSAEGAALARDVAAVRERVLRSGEAANAADPEGIIALYARDVVLSYPGVPDSDYETLARGYREMLRTPGVVLRTVPDIHEILVSGDLAVVRVTWTTTVTRGTPAWEATRLARDLQIWRREADGSWKFARGMHYRTPVPAAADSAARRPGA